MNMKCKVDRPDMYQLMMETARKVGLLNNKEPTFYPDMPFFFLLDEEVLLWSRANREERKTHIARSVNWFAFDATEVTFSEFLAALENFKKPQPPFDFAAEVRNDRVGVKVPRPPFSNLEGGYTELSGEVLSFWKEIQMSNSGDNNRQDLLNSLVKIGATAQRIAEEVVLKS